MTAPEARSARTITDKEKTELRIGISAARLYVKLDKKQKRVTDPRIVALAAMEKPY